MNKNILILGEGFLSKGIKKNISKKFRLFIIGRKKINFFLSNKNKFLDLINKSKISIIINCIGNTRKNLDFDEYVDSNIKIPIKFLNIITNTKLIFINFASQDEDKVKDYFENKLLPKNNHINYALSKSILTRILKKNVFNNYIMNLKIPIIYGFDAPKHMLFGEALEMQSLNKHFVINNPNYLNNFIHIGELVKILELLLDSRKFIKKYYYDVISNNKPQKVYDFIKCHFPEIKIKLKIQLKKKKIKNQTLVTKNKSIINFFK